MTTMTSHHVLHAVETLSNCQVAVSVHAATDSASCPLQWRLFLPEEWASDTGRRAITRVQPEVTHREK